MESVLGAGSYGLVISSEPQKATKLFYDIYNPHAIQKEAELQQKARALLQNIVQVPKIYDIQASIASFCGKSFIHGIISGYQDPAS